MLNRRSTFPRNCSKAERPTDERFFAWRVSIAKTLPGRRGRDSPRAHRTDRDRDTHQGDLDSIGMSDPGKRWKKMALAPNLVTPRTGEPLVHWLPNLHKSLTNFRPSQ